MAGRHAIAMELGPRRLCAIAGSVDRDGVLTVTRMVEAGIPDGVAGGDAATLGLWIGERLRDAGIASAPVTLALGRDRIGLKRLRLPTVDADEIPQMTRLALQRELAFDAATAVVDYLPLGVEGGRSLVLGVAVPEEVRDEAFATMKAAGLSLASITLRLNGSAALLETAGMLSGDDPGGVLVVDVSGSAVEFTVFDGNDVRFSRGVDVGEPTAELVVTEARRTWMSYRMSDDTRDAVSAQVFAPPDLARAAASELSSVLSADVRVFADHPNVRVDGDLPIERAWPLVGALLGPVHGLPSIDILHPRRSRDRAAERRRRNIMVAALVGIVLLLGWSLAQRDLGGLDDRITELTKTQRGLVGEQIEVTRELYQVRHLKQWSGVQADWLEHVRSLTELTPPPSEVVFDGWYGAMDFNGVEFDRKTDEWSAPKELTIVLEGEARDRTIADAVRAALVEASWYVTTSTGSDAASGKRLPVGFTYRLRTSESAPPDVHAVPVEELADRSGGAP